MAGPFKNVALILHAGDALHRGMSGTLSEDSKAHGLANIINHLGIPVIIARGNCDTDYDASLLAVPLQFPPEPLDIDKWRIMVLHGNGQREEDLERNILVFHLDLLVHGHSHIARIKKVGQSLIVNPGTPTIPNPSSPFGKTVALFDTSEGTVRVEDIETGKTLLHEQLHRG
jgi:uncharacterized protein